MFPLPSNNPSLMDLPARTAGLGSIQTLIASGSRINVRAQPSTSSPTLRSVDKGQPVGTVEESFSGGDGFIWYALNEGGFVREDVVTVSTVQSSTKPNKKFNFLNPWLIIGSGAVLITIIAIATKKERPVPPAVPQTRLSGNRKKKTKTKLRGPVEGNH